MSAKATDGGWHPMGSGTPQICTPSTVQPLPQPLPQPLLQSLRLRKVRPGAILRTSRQPTGQQLQFPPPDDVSTVMRYPSRAPSVQLAIKPTVTTPWPPS